MSVRSRGATRRLTRATAAQGSREAPASRCTPEPRGAGAARRGAPALPRCRLPKARRALSLPPRFFFAPPPPSGRQARPFRAVRSAQRRRLHLEGRCPQLKSWYRTPSCAALPVVSRHLFAFHFDNPFVYSMSFAIPRADGRNASAHSVGKEEIPEIVASKIKLFRYITGAKTSLTMMPMDHFRPTVPKSFKMADLEKSGKFPYVVLLMRGVMHIVRIF